MIGKIALLPLAFVLTTCQAQALAQTTVSPLDVTSRTLVDPAGDIREIADNDGETEGLEVRGTVHLTPRWIVSAGVTYGTLASDPRYRWRAATDYALTDRLSVGVSYLHVTGRSGIDSGGDYVTTPGYDVINAKAVYAFSRHVSIQAVINNVGDDHYIDGLADPADAAGNKRSIRGALLFEY